LNTTVSSPSVSLVIPAYNAGPYLGEAIDSVLSQDRPLEIIVIDDGSTDDTAEVARSFGSAIDFIRQPNAGQSAALNRGWSIAKGELIGYLSADDRLRPGGVQRVAEAFDRTPDAVLAYPDFGLIDEHSRETGQVHPPEYSRERLFAELYCLPGPGALFRKAAFERAGGWDASFCQIPDLDFFLRMALQGRFVRVPHLAADFRMHSESATFRPGPAERAEEPIRMVKGFFAREGLPADVLGWRRDAFSSAYFLAATMHLRSRRVARAFQLYVEAAAQKPSAALGRKSVSFAAELAKSLWGAPQRR